MAKKSNSSKVSKIKSSKFNKEELLSKKPKKSETIKVMSKQDEQPEPNFDDIQQNNSVEQDVNFKDIPEVLEQEQVIEKENLSNKNINESIIQKLTEENKRLESLINSLKEDNLNIQKSLDNEREQLKSKLEEKAAIANKQVEERLAKLEAAKQDEIVHLRDSIYIDVISNFLDPILLFETTVEQAPADNPAVFSYIQGYKMIISMFKDKLNNLGIEQIDVNVGDEFNESFMEAFDVEENSQFPPNKVVKIVNKGFVYKNKVIKFTSVVVSK